MQYYTTTVRKFENGAEYLGYLTANIIGTHVQFYYRKPGQERYICVDNRDTAQRFTSLLAEFMNSNYVIID